MSSVLSPPPPPPPNLLSPPHHHQNLAYHLLPPLIAASVTLSLLLLLLFIWRRLFHLLYRRPKPPSLSSGHLPRRFSFSVLHRATSSFSSSRRLGQGGFGAVFSATLTLTPNVLIPVAVKLMDSRSLQGEREFHNEILLAEKTAQSDRVVKLIGFASSRRRRRMCLVYELLPKGNLQNCLLHRKCKELLEWRNRFRIAIQVAEGLAFLHHQCNPPVIHGDIKPSNILLDAQFCAKIGDFGLARLKLVDNHDNDVVIDIGGIDKSNRLGACVEDIESLMETESVTTMVGFEEYVSVGVDQSPDMVTALASPMDLFDSRNDDIDGGLEGQFDNVVSENCIGETGCSSSVVSRTVESKKRKKKKFEWRVTFDEEKNSKKEKRRPSREWWKEEYYEELAKKKKKKKHQSVTSEHDQTKTKKGRSNVDWWLDGFSGSYDSVSGGISSTPSMRGTVCYIAPEYSSGADLSEKCDVYSFGVLLLVLVAGRRPLQVNGSPASEFHRANLVSWARKLARSGKLLDLVDKKITYLNREQAQLCVVVALICLQKPPERRPTMTEVMGMLMGELDPPQLPMEYLSSPTSQNTFKSRKKLR